MSRDYLAVRELNGQRKFWMGGPTFNMNVWSVEYYGRIFRDLGLPTTPYSHTCPEIPGFLHEYTGADLEAVRTAMQDPEFHSKLIVAIGNANHEMRYHDESPEAIAADMEKNILPAFQDPKTVAVASSYCDRYR